MNLAVVSQLGTLARDALTANFWGHGCPAHCQGSSIPSILCAFILGFLCGIILLLCLWIWTFQASPSAIPQIPVSFARRAASDLRSRLRGYRPALHEQS